eukprot:1667728-Pleurochrysis_carterae.AAC.1
MSTHRDLAQLAATKGVGRMFFDQCVFGAPTPKATQLIASEALLAQLSPRFSERFCSHPPGTHNSIVGMAANGAAYYPTEMNAALADSILALLPTTAALLRDAGGESRVDAEEEMLNLFETSDADSVTEAYGLKVHGDDNPTWAPMRGDEPNQWRDAARAETQNFERHGVYVEARLRSHRYDVSAKEEKGREGRPSKYKARAVVCANQQKRKALASGAEHTLETFAPAARTATFKSLCAMGCIADLRVRQFDVKTAYLQAKETMGKCSYGPYTTPA